MSSKEQNEPIITIKFLDNSEFSLPTDWEDVFADYYGQNPAIYPTVAEKLRFVTEKYVQNKAWPSKYDGLIQRIEREERGEVAQINLSDYDNPDFYWEHWSDWPPEGINWDIPRRKIKSPPAWADVAKAAMYQTIRGGLLQKGLQQLGSNLRVITPKQFLREIDDQQ